MSDTKYIRVGMTDFPLDFVTGMTFEELETRYHYLPKNVIRELSRQVSPKVVRYKAKKKDNPTED